MACLLHSDLLYSVVCPFLIKTLLTEISQVQRLLLHHVAVLVANQAIDPAVLLLARPACKQRAASVFGDGDDPALGLFCFRWTSQSSRFPSEFIAAGPRSWRRRRFVSKINLAE